jgi:hypothetical protein
MPRFVTIGYGDRTGYERTAPEVRDAAHDHDKELWERGVLTSVAGETLQVSTDGEWSIHVVTITRRRVCCH